MLSDFKQPEEYTKTEPAGDSSPPTPEDVTATQSSARDIQAGMQDTGVDIEKFADVELEGSPAEEPAEPRVLAVSLDRLVTLADAQEEPDGESTTDSAPPADRREDLAQRKDEVPVPALETGGSGDGKPPIGELPIPGEEDDPGEESRETQPEKVRFIHQTSERVYVNESPENPKVQEVAEGLLAENRTRREEYKEFVDAAPRMNEMYADELQQAKAYLESEGLEVPPFIVLGPSDFRRALSTAFFEPPDASTLGFFYAGRAILQAPGGKLDTLQGRSIIHGLALHEAGHQGEELDPIVVSKPTGGLTSEGKPIQGCGLVNGQTGFRTYEVQDNGEVVMKGGIIEEGFVDLLRVRGMAQAGKTPQTRRKSVRLGGIEYVGERGTLSLDRAVLPIEYAFYFKDHTRLPGDYTAMHMKAAPAAYGLALLDQRDPGVFDLMKIARTDPRMMDELRDRVNGIRPGLYDQLDRLQYDKGGLVQSLRMIQAAVQL